MHLDLESCRFEAHYGKSFILKFECNNLDYSLTSWQRKTGDIVQSIYVKNRVNLPLIATEFIPSPVVSENILE